MNRSVSVAEAKNNLPSLLREVEQGSIVEITRYGKTVAMVLPERDYRRMAEGGQGFWASLGKVRNIISSEGIVIDENDLGNLRDSLPGRDLVWTA